MEKNLADKRKTEKDNIYLTRFGADGGNNSIVHEIGKHNICSRKAQIIVIEKKK